MLTIPNLRLLTFGFIAFILIGLEQGLLGLFMADMGTLLARSLGFTSAFMESLAEQNRGNYIVAGQ